MLKEGNCSETLRFLNVTSEIPCRIALRRWNFLTLDLFSYGLGSKCLDLLNSYERGAVLFAIILGQVLKMCLIMAVGFLISRIGLITHEGNKGLSNLLLLVVNPLMLFQSFMIEYTPRRMRDFLISALLAVVVHAISIVVASIVARRNPNTGIERICMVFSNCGFMGIPLIHAALGNEGVLYLTPYIVVFTVFLWTYGLAQMTGRNDFSRMMKSLVNPAIVAIIVGLVFFVTGLRLPTFMSEGLGTLADMNTPLAMLIAGISLAESDLGEALRKKRLYLVCAVKLVIIPLLMMVLFMFLPVSRDIRYVNLIAAACPAATSGTLFALRYGGDYRYSAEIFAVCTLFSMITIPVIVFLMEVVI